MQPAYRKFGYFYIPVQFSDFFPPGKAKTKHPVRIDTETGVLQAELQYNTQAHV
jgi:hypothetical protein